MFDVTPDMERTWLAQGKPVATAADIARMEAALGIALAPAYVAFVTRHGFVIFGGDAECRQLFRHMFQGDAGEPEERATAVSYMHEPDELININRYMWTSDGPDDDYRPMIPNNFVAVASDRGHGSILLELDGKPGRVWYWPESDFRWGTEDNTRIAFVADDFAEFIGGLRPDLDWLGGEPAK